MLASKIIVLYSEVVCNPAFQLWWPVKRWPNRKQPKDLSVINSVLKAQYNQTLGLHFLLKGSSQKKMLICSALKLPGNAPLYNHLVEGQIEK